MKMHGPSYKIVQICLQETDKFSHKNKTVCEVGTLAITFLYRTCSTLIMFRTSDIFSLSLRTYESPPLSYLIINRKSSIFLESIHTT
jgi:hypothetical protein